MQSNPGNHRYSGGGWTIRPPDFPANTGNVGPSQAMFDDVDNGVLTPTQQAWYRYPGTTTGNVGITFFVYGEMLLYLENRLGITGAGIMQGTMAKIQMLNTLANTYYGYNAGEEWEIVEEELVAL